MLGSLESVDKANCLITVMVPMGKIDDIAKLEGQDIELTIDKKRKKRSLNANGFMWELCEKIARKIGGTKEDVYRRAVREVGLFRDVELEKKASSTIQVAWENNGIGWFSELISSNNKTETIRLYYGSSSYNTEQMARLLAYIKDDADELHIDEDTYLGAVRW